MWYYFIENNATTTIYAWDIISILGVLMVYLTLVWLIVTKKAEKKVLQGRQIVIEV